MVVESYPSLGVVLCITVDNSPVRGAYLADPGAQDASSFRAKADSVKSGVRPAPPAASASYDVGVAIPATLDFGSGARPAYGGYWALPGAGAGGSCTQGDGGAFARWRSDRAPATCTSVLVLDAAGEGCAALGGARFTTSLRLSRAPTPSAPTVAVALSSVVDAVTGAPYGPAMPVPSWDAATCTCRGVVTSVAYRLIYSNAGGLQTLTSASAAVAVANVTQATGCGVQPVSIPLSSSLTFIGPRASPHLPGSSGAPGYLIGSPLLAGALVANGAVSAAGAPVPPADKLAIASGPVNGPQSLWGLATSGLALRGAASDGACVSFDQATAAAWTDGASREPVLFGVDTSTSCTLKLTRAELAARCVAGGTANFFGVGYVSTDDPVTGVPGAAPVGYIGVLGNADTWKSWQWTALATSSAPAAAPVWTAATSTCAGVGTGLDVEVLYTRVGEASNSQRKVLAARVTRPTDVWTWGREDAFASGRQTFLLRSTVTFTEWQPIRSADYIPPAPPIIPPMPSDLWYPFASSSSSQAGQYVVSGAGGVAAGAALLCVAAAATALLA